MRIYECKSIEFIMKLVAENTILKEFNMSADKYYMMYLFMDNDKSTKSWLICRFVERDHQVFNQCFIRANNPRRLIHREKKSYGYLGDTVKYTIFELNDLEVHMHVMLDDI